LLELLGSMLNAEQGARISAALAPIAGGDSVAAPCECARIGASPGERLRAPHLHG
jgi:hypothetical protein